MPFISDADLASMHSALHDGAAFAASVRRDESGDMIGMHYVGGNGGNISRDSLKLLGRFELSLNSLPAGSKEG